MKDFGHLAEFASVMPEVSGVEMPIAPVSRTTGTIGRERKRRAKKGMREPAIYFT